MRNTNLATVADTLALGKSRSRAEISTITGLSYATVLRALNALRATRVADTYPIEYTIESGAIVGAAKRSRNRGADGDARVFDAILTQKHFDDVPSVWLEAQDALLKGLPKLNFDSHRDPTTLYTNLVGAAELLGSFALALKPYLNDPLWHDQISNEKSEPSRGKLKKVVDNRLDSDNA
jgi:hypothetical protein